MERKAAWFFAGLALGALIGMVVCALLDAMLHARESASPSSAAIDLALKQPA